MPLYDYRCTECEREVEVMHAIHDSGPETCASCGGAMRKALSTPAIHFKGSGWAKKDAAAASAKKAQPKASSASTSPTGEKGEGKPKEASESAAAADSGESGSGSKVASSPTQASSSGKTD